MQFSLALCTSALNPSQRSAEQPQTSALKADLRLVNLFLSIILGLERPASTCSSCPVGTLFFFQYDGPRSPQSFRIPTLSC